jgi:NTE family protein
MLILQVDLFPARGALPTNLAEVLARQKDIQYSSRTRYNTDMAVKFQNARETVREILATLPESVRRNPRVRDLEKWLAQPPVDIVHLIYRQRPYEHESKDYDFSRASVLEHWCAGAADMRDSLNHPEWLANGAPLDGVTVYDFLRPAAPAKKTPGA